MASLNMQAYADRDGRFYPKMCADCIFWLDDHVRDVFGRRGYCSKQSQLMYRTDWCSLPEEKERHEKAMENYTAINYKGERIKPCKPAS